MSPRTEAENTEWLLRELAGSMAFQEARVRTQGEWCFMCGAGHSLGTCRCSFPESLQCHEQKMCLDCRSAHKFVAEHIKEMLSAKRSDRSSSIRTKKFFQLHNAAETVEEQSSNVERRAPDWPIERNLTCSLADATPWDDTNAEFRGAVLGAFRAVKFSEYRALAKALQSEKEAELRHKAAMYFSSCVR
jgi:hypothetical protein